MKFICKVWWRKSMLTMVYEYHQLKRDTFRNTPPMQVTKKWFYLLDPMTSWAAAFRTDCSLSYRRAEMEGQNLTAVA